MSVQESLAEGWFESGLPWGQWHWLQQLGISPFEGVWPQAKPQEGNTVMALPIRARPRFPHSQSLPSGSFHKPHPYPSEARQNGNLNYRKLTKLTTWITVLSNSMKLWTMPCRVIQPSKTRPGVDCSSDHELLMAKYRLKWQKAGKTTRSFRYDINQIPYN